MVISDTWYMIDGFTIALLTAEFGQVWAEHVCRDVMPQLWRKSDGKRKHSGGGVAVPSDNANVELKLKKCILQYTKYTTAVA